MAVARPVTHLSRLVDDLGAALLDVSVLPDRDPPVRGVGLYDPYDDPLSARGDVVLGVGVRGSGTIATLLRDLGRVGAAGLVVRGPVDVGQALRRAVHDSGVGLLGLDGSARWLQVAALLRGSLARDDRAAADGAAGIPPGLPSGDLFALANAVAALLDAPIVIEDTSLRVLAYSTRQDEADAGRVETILARQPPQRLRRLLEERGVLRELFTSAEPVYVADLGGDLLPRAAVAVRAGEELLGSMWAAVRRPLSVQRAQAFADAARVVALHMLRARATADVGRRLRSDLVATLLDGRHGAADAAARLELATARLCVVAAQPLAGEGLVQEAARLRLTDALAVHCAAIDPHAAVALLGGVTYAVLPLRQGEGDERALAVAREFLARTGDRDGVVAGVGRVAESAGGVPASRRDAERVLRVLRSGGGGCRAARLRDVQLESLLLTVSDALAGRGGEVYEPVSLLMAYDARHQTNFVDTVTAWLDAFGSVNEAAAAVHVHPNTFRYRLRRLSEISGLDLDDPDQRLAVMLALRLRGPAPAATPDANRSDRDDTPPTRGFPEPSRHRP